MRRHVADDDGAAVIMHRPGEDFGSRCREFGSQHYQRAVPSDFFIFVAIVFGAALAVADLEDGAFGDEQSGNIDGLGEQAAAVFTEVHDKGLHAHLLKFADQLLDVLGRTGAGAVGILTVESGKVDDAECDGGGAIGDVETTGGSHLPDQLDLIAFEHDRLAAAGGHIDKQSDDGSLGTADAGDRLVQAHADDVVHLAFFALANGDDLVAGFNLAGDFQWPAG